MSNEVLVKRIVRKASGVVALNRETGERYHAKQGETIEVTPKQASAFANILEDPSIAEARAKADAEVQAAQAEAEAKVDAKKSRAKSKE